MLKLACQVFLSLQGRELFNIIHYILYTSITYFSTFIIYINLYYIIIYNIIHYISYNTGFIKHFSQIHLKRVVHKFFFSMEKKLKDYKIIFIFLPILCG